ncbi:hypothetical protein LXM94_19275 [Rhizobium sp. TRM95111]|uniref:hypothetical protein n=1 Tax=Rhizobium alarense TaxID=2846851 RepID=UPI001F40068D|nr:hypothetical protein [Rhizobium alarense]MCF3642113.1 hypothetical protein [Rhizobium alarense]
MFWTIAVFALLLAGVVFMRTYKRDDGVPPERDAGLEILEFGRAFPNEAIRETIRTEDGRAVFLRLYDGKVGCMRAHGQHFVSHLIEPGKVRVETAADGRSLVLAFIDTPSENGTFRFRTGTDCAEVSLWLLGSLVPAFDRDAEDGTASGSGG